MSTFTDASDAFQRDLLIPALERNGWKISPTARDVGMDRRKLTRLMERLNITPPVKQLKPVRVKRRYQRRRTPKT